MAKQFGTVQEGAAYLGIHHMTMREWIASGKFPAYRFSGKCIRIRFSDLEAFAEKNAICPAS